MKDMPVTAINYVEFPSADLQITKLFFGAVFGWRFTDYGPEYCSIDNAGLDGGFYLVDQSCQQARGSVLVVLYSDELEACQQRVLAHGGSISKETFEFPGGRRFHFTDPNGNEYAVWQHT
ncbi:MAG: VOC family protein [Pseudomonadales bacterium]